MPSNNSKGTYSYTIPERVGEVEAVLHGARGGDGGGDGSGDDDSGVGTGGSGGNGGYIKGRYSVSVTSTQSLVILIGAEGNDGDGEYIPTGQDQFARTGAPKALSPLNDGSGGGDGQFLEDSENTFGYGYAPGGGSGGGESGIEINNSIIATASGGGGGGGAGAYDIDVKDDQGDGGDGGQGGGATIAESGGVGGSGGEGENGFGQSVNASNGSGGGVNSISSFNTLASANGGSNSGSGSITVNYAPKAPTSISVTNTGKDISINWGTAQNQTAYRLFRDGNKVFDGNSTSYSESVTAGNSYTYTVSAYNTYGESTSTASASVTIPPAIVHRIKNGEPEILTAKKWNGSNWIDTETYQTDGNNWFR